MGYVVMILLILLLLAAGMSMIARYGLRRRIGRAREQLPEGATLTGTALLVGTNYDDSLRGIGALAVTRDSLVFVAGADGRRLEIPRAGLLARPHRRKPNQRAASLRVEWDGRIAQFEVDSPKVADWVAQLS